MGTITTSYFTFTATNLVLQPKHFFSHNLANNTLYPSLPFSHSTTSQLKCRVKLKTFSIPTTTHLKVSQDAFTPTEESSLASNPPPAIGDNDLLIVGPGVLGRLVAHKWRQEIPGCQVYAQTMTTDHHDELIQMGINPSLKWIESTHKFPNVIFCAPPSRTPDYADNIRRAALSWNGEGSILFTSSTAPYDCSDNGPCDEDTPVVPAGRSPRIDVLLKAENVVLEFGGCVLRLAGLYISFM
ncbi:hypothetical protein RIF29_26616 [Crotalaria pallida]|uniref:NAD(P)-binding domain-containing protein n=1 Tax=Crotalaria pallida TaxID=3830 RepID=A0AAN9I4Y9_CROPI